MGVGGELKDKTRSRLKGSKDKRGWGRWLEFKVRRRALHPVDFALRKFMVAKQLLSNGAADQISLSQRRLGADRARNPSFDQGGRGQLRVSVSSPQARA